VAEKTVTFGEIMLRLTPPGWERFLQSPVLGASFGGGEANVAVALASWGIPAMFVTVLPENPIADAAVGELRRFGVDTSGIVRGMGRLGIYFLKVVYDRAGSAIAMARPGDIDWSRVFDGAGWFHLTGITPAISSSAADLALEAVEKSKAAGITVSVDLNFRKNLWKWGKAAEEVMRPLTARADIAIGNEEDVQRALGIQSAADVESGKLNVKHYEELTARVLAEFPNLRAVALTLRESRSASHNGWSACLRERDEFLVSRRYEITHIVDRVGSGDSFAAGMIYGFQALSSRRDALEFAAAAGCLKHSVPGDFHRASVEEVNALLKDGGSGRVER